MQNPPYARTAFYALAVPGILLVVVLTSGQSYVHPLDVLNYWLILAFCVLASTPPHILLPDPRQSLHQLANVSAKALQQHQWRRWRMVMLGLLPPPLIVIIIPPWMGEEMVALYLIRFVAFSALIWGVGMYSFMYYHGLGLTSQEWSEGKRGAAYHWLKKETPYRLAIPDGLVPAFSATAYLFLVGAAGMLATLYLNSLSVALGMVPAVGMLIWSFTQYRRQTASFDAAYYHSNAFFREIFAGGRIHPYATKQLPYSSVYWAPARWQPAVWMSLTQLDRRLPLGRVMAFGHGLLWVLMYRNADPLTIAAYLSVLIIAQKTTLALLMRPTMSPPRFTHTHLSRAGWVGVRTFVNARWSFVMLLSLLCIVLLSDRMTLLEAGFWTLADLGASFLFALSFTLIASRRFQHHYA